MSGNIGHFKYVSFQKKRGTEQLRCPNIKGKYGNVQNAFTKEGAGVSLFFVVVFLLLLLLLFFFGGWGDCFSPERVY